MRIEDICHVKGRGALALVTLDGPEPKGRTVRRASDGATWRVIAIEWWCIPRRPGAGDKCGLLLRGESAFAPGDELEVLPEEAAPAPSGGEAEDYARAAGEIDALATALERVLESETHADAQWIAHEALASFHGR